MNIKKLLSILAIFLLSAPLAVADEIIYVTGDVGDYTYNQGGTIYWVLKGNVTLYGTITVDNSTTLRILNYKSENGDKTIKITNGVDGTRKTPMFKVIGKAKLAFNYKDLPMDVSSSDATKNTADDEDDLLSRYNPIILDGGANFKAMDRDSDSSGKWTLTAQTNKRFTVSMIQTIGAIEMCHTTIQNYYAPDDFDGLSYTGVGAIGIAPPNLFADGSNLAYRYTTIKHCVIQKCKSRTGVAISVGNSDYLNTTSNPRDDDRKIVIEDTTFKDNVVFCDKSGWGGIIRCRGTSVHCMTLRRCTFTGNFSHGDGAGLWWNAGGHEKTRCVINGCKFTNNRAMRNSGAMRLETTFLFYENVTTVSGNECLGLTRVSTSPDTYEHKMSDKGNGAGIHIFGYASSAYQIGGEGKTFTYLLDGNLEVTDNHAYGQGGGIAFDFTQAAKLLPGTTIDATFDGLLVEGNTAGMCGGGIYMNNTTTSEQNYKFNVYLNSGKIKTSSAPMGGGLYVYKLDVTSNDTGKVTISTNKATAGNGGGICIIDGNLTLNSVNVTSNEAYKVNDGKQYGGGGVYVQNGSFTINSGEVKKNVSDMYGGGIFVCNTSADGGKKSITLQGGTIHNNEALYGGGIAAYGDLGLTITNVDLQYNTAHNGGGILTHGVGSGKEADINYTSGLIRYNEATSTAAATTAYNVEYTNVSGMGGGFYLGEYTKLRFTNPTQFGIYANKAANGADDLFGYNRYVDVTLPNVANLELNGYSEAQMHELFWGEDYITNDPYYDKGTKIKGSAWDTDKTNQRYRSVRENSVQGHYYTLDFGSKSSINYTIDATGESKYLCLTLGWNVGMITIIKKGMKSGESAVFKIYKIDGSTKTEYMTLLLSDNDLQPDGVTRAKEVALNSDGTWMVEELPWSWAYTSDVTSITRELNAGTTTEMRKFTFTNTPKSDAPIHSESLKVNNM